MFYTRASARPREGILGLAGAALAAAALGILGVVGVVPPGPASASPHPVAAVRAERAPGGQRPVVLVGSQLELRRAVAVANRRPGTDRIGLTRSVALAKGSGKGPGALRLDLDVTDDLVLNGAGFSIDGRDLDRILDVAEGVRLDLNNLTLRNGAPAVAGEGGGLLRVTGGTARLGRVSLTNGEALGGASGGAAANDGGRLVLVNSTVEASTASTAGGGIAASGGATVLRGTSVTGNQASGEGGHGAGLQITGGSVTLDDVAVRENRATTDGGGIWADASSSVTVRDSVVTQNASNLGAGARGGGGIYYGRPETDETGTGGRLLVIGSALSRNTSSANGSGPSRGEGGGLLNDHGSVELRDSTVTGNISLASGGGIAALDASTTLDGVEVSGNSTVTADRSPARGGGLAVDGGTADLSGGTVRDNQASAGGGISTSGDLDLVGIEVAGNTAQQSGGGIEVVFGAVGLDDVDLHANTVFSTQGRGGGLHVTGEGLVSINGSRVTDNEGGLQGGGLWNSGSGRMSVTGTDVSRNTVSASGDAAGGGGLYQAQRDGGGGRGAPGTLYLTRVTVSENRAVGSGGVGGGLLSASGFVIVDGSTFDRNVARIVGGGVVLSGRGGTARGRVSLTDTDLVGNTAGSPGIGEGGGLAVEGAGLLQLDRGQITANRAGSRGGGISNSAEGTLTLTNAEVSGNGAPTAPDAYQGGETAGGATVNGQVVPTGDNRASYPRP